MNHESDNFYAEMLLKQLPAAAGKVGTSAGGGAARDRDDARGGDPGRGGPHGRRLRALEPRSPHGRRARRRHRGRRHGPVDQGRVHRLAGGRRRERDAQPAPAGAPRPGEGQDGHDRPRLHAVGPDPQRGRVRGARERKPRLVVGGARGPGSLRHDPRGARTSRGAARAPPRVTPVRRATPAGRPRRGSARRPSPPSRPSSPGSRRR